MTRDTTIDQREVDFYSRLASTWWDREGPFWPLHKLNELRVGYIRDRLCQRYGRDPDSSTPLQGLRILDVGCGGGILSESMARLGADVTGIDVVEKNIQVAKLHAAQQQLAIDYQQRTASSIAAAGEQFNVVLNMEVVEHVADVDAFMRDCCSLTAADGVMFVATLNRTFLAWLFAIVGAEYVLRWLPRGTHRWRWFRKPSEMRRLLAAGGLSVVDSVGVAANPLRRGLRLTGTLAVNYMLFSARTSR